MFSQKFLISVALIACCAIPASAALVTYCDVTLCSDPSSGFAGATVGDTFQNISATGSIVGGDSYTDLGVDFSDPAGLSLVTDLGGLWPDADGIVTNATSPSGNTMTITLPSSVSAIDFYVGMQTYDNFTISVTDSNGATFTDGYFASTPTSAALFGITTDSTFTTFTITSQSSVDQITLDGISIGSGSSGGGDPGETPEVTTLVLVGTGLFLMGYGRRWLPGRAGQAARRGTVRTMSTGITPA